MQEEQNKAVDVEAGDSDTIEALKKMRENTVPKADYEKLKADNKKLLDAFVNGEDLEKPEEKKKTEDELLKSIYEAKGSNMELAQDIVELYDMKKAQGKNIFVGSRYSNTVEQNAAEADAEEAVQYLRNALEQSDGDPTVFQAMFGSKIVDK
jgi:hypothetical protein